MTKNLLINSAELLSILSGRFPPISNIIAYGSGVFKQPTNTQNSQIDLIFCVEDLRSWHRENRKFNGQDYSGLGRLLPVDLFIKLSQQLSPIHYNPFIQLNQKYLIKYGVIQNDVFLSDLLSWDHFIVSGRLQKPVLFLKKQEKLEPLETNLSSNLKGALACGVLLTEGDQFTKRQLFETITSLSYLGDLRFSMKGESRSKISDIVLGSYEQFEHLYDPLIQGFLGIERLNFQKIQGFLGIERLNFQKIEKLEKNWFDQEKLYESLAKTFKNGQKPEITSILSQFTALNKKMSQKMMFQTLFFNSPSLNAKYVYQKLRKTYKK